MKFGSRSKLQDHMYAAGWGRWIQRAGVPGAKMGGEHPGSNCSLGGLAASLLGFEVLHLLLHSSTAHPAVCLPLTSQ